jgi:alanine racemase
MVMVKALAYGSGSFEIANLLQHEKIDYLGVAFTDEGIALRKAGISIPIMVMSPGTEDFKRIIEFDLEPEIYSFNTLHNFIHTASNMQVSTYPVHIKIDTGMHRLGFQENEIEKLIPIIKNNNHIYIKWIFSHLAASDKQQHDNFTRNQISTFNKITRQLSDHLGYQPKKHILNSAGIERFPEAHFDMVRLGIGLYGISAVNKPLSSVSNLKTHISQIKLIPKGETIGYNRAGKAFQDLTIAIIPIGYADGLNRKFGNGTGHVIIKNKKFPFIGDICMDMSMIDVTKETCNEGDEVIIFGDSNPIQTLAKQIDTIPYEILTNISSRVKRIYIKD